MLEREIQDGFTELSCHPGYVDADCVTGYGLEREAELRALCDPRIREVLTERSIRLVSYCDIARLLASTPRQESYADRGHLPI